ncbi:MAG TPA: MBOAT family O-acyltransferase [Polyangiaceae bacterium]|jgi:hypothetical protein|nr:MBOAT family O-acyltransferase [Polyangiaceae bacterium]
MVTSLLPPLSGAIRHMAVLLSLRLLPFAAYVLVARRLAAGRRVALVAAYAGVSAVAVSLGGLRSLELIVAGCAYYVIVSLGLNPLGRWLAAGLLTRGAAFALVFFAFVLVPGVAIPGAALTTFLVVGWDLVMRSYSYCVDTSLPGAMPPPLGEGLFFLHVNPTLVYSARGTPSVSAGAAGGGLRAAAGAALMFANAAALRPFASYLKHSPAWAAHVPAGAALALVFYGAAMFLTVYAAHSGLASIQIGLMREVGWTVPERYRWPILATSPMDFWRRWNVYVRLWLEAYVFLPLARRVARRTRRRSAQAAVAVVTLLASGLLHDLYRFGGAQVVSAVTIELFLGAAALLAAWRAAGWMGEKFRSAIRPGPWFDLAARCSARLGLAAAVLAAAIGWG